jgi:hypothetical protein
MLKLLWHVVKLGHSVEVNRHITTPLFSRDKGWLYRCECGETWAK